MNLLAILSALGTVPFRLDSPGLAAAIEPGPNGEPPEWLHLVPYGTWLGHPTGPIAIDANVGRVILQNHTMRGTELVVDFEHQTLMAEFNGQPAPAVAWVDRLELRDNGVWGHVRLWTDRGAILVKAREYRYLSPVISRFWRDPKTGTERGFALHSAALTNVPFFGADLVPVAARSPTTGAPMDPRLLALLALVGLPKEATEDQVNTTITARKARDEAACRALGLEPAATAADVQAAAAPIAARASLGDVVCRVLKLDAKALPGDAAARAETELKHSGYVPYAEHVAALQKGERDLTAATDEQLLAQCRAEGKLTPALEGWAKATVTRDRAGFLTWMRAAAPVVPVGASTVLPPPPTGERLTEPETAVCKQLGISPDTFKKER